MIRRSFAPTLLAAALLCACGEDAAAEPVVEEVTLHGQGGDAANRIETLPQVDTSRLAGAEKRRWVDLVNDLTSPCGEPVSIARCVSEERACSRCVQSARFLARLSLEGYERGEMRELHQLRYGRDSLVELDIAGAPVRGAPMSPVTIVEFSDFQCPHCRAAHPVLARIARELEGRVKVVFKNYPLSGHTHAVEAAVAAAAAHEQGKFWEMHDVLFDNQENLEPADIERYAQQVGLDMERFRADIARDDLRERVEAEKEQGAEIGVNSTPSLFINGRRFDEPLESLPAYLQEELDQ